MVRRRSLPTWNALKLLIHSTRHKIILEVVKANFPLWHQSRIVSVNRLKRDIDSCEEKILGQKVENVGRTTKRYLKTKKKHKIVERPDRTKNSTNSVKIMAVQWP